MTRRMSATELKAHLLRLLDDVAAGDEIEITKHGRTIARLIPAKSAHALKGRFADVAVGRVSDEELFTTGMNWDLPE